VVGEHAHGFKLVGLEKVGFVDFTDRRIVSTRPDLRLLIDYMSATESGGMLP